MTAEARAETERIPRLVRDNWRVWLTTGISIPTGSPRQSATGGRAAGRPGHEHDDPDDRLLPRGYVVLFALYRVLTWRVFARLVQVAIVTLSLLSVALGWTMIVFAYTLMYLRQNVEHPGLVFPGRPELVWRDCF